MTASDCWGRENTPSDARPVEFDAAWPSAQARMAAVLRTRGLQATDVDDVVQEVALRALRDGQRFVSHDHFVRWCCRVAINVHIDGTRRQARLSPHPPPDVASSHDTAATAEHRIALERLTAGIAELSPEERRLLLESEPAESRREAVRLAVRRHRLRARLAAMLEGLVALLALLRRASRNLSPSTKAAIAAMPVVAGFIVAPLALAPYSSPSDAGTPSHRAVPLALEGPAAARRPGAGNREPSTDRRERSAATNATLRLPSQSPAAKRTLVALNPAGPPVKVTQERRPDQDPTLCVFGRVNVCAKRPGPPVTQPTLTQMP